MTLLVRFGAVLGLLSLAACGGIPIYTVSYEDTYHPGETLAPGGDLPVVVRGDPYGDPAPDFAVAVVDAMQGWSAWQDHFTASGNPNAPYRVIMVFNPASNAASQAYCARPLAVDGTSGPGASARLVGVVCRGSTYLSQVDGMIDTKGGPQDAAFRQAVGRATLLLFPGQNPLATNCPSC